MCYKSLTQQPKPDIHHHHFANLMLQNGMQLQKCNLPIRYPTLFSSLFISMVPSLLCYSALIKLGLNPNTQSSSSNWTSRWTPASSMLSGFIYGSITGTVYKTALNVYPLKLNSLTWDVVKPMLLLQGQLMVAKKAPQRPTDSALVSEHHFLLHQCLQRDPRCLRGTASLAKDQVTHTHKHTLTEHSQWRSILVIIPINCSANTEGTSGVLFPSLKSKPRCLWQFLWFFSNVLLKWKSCVLVSRAPLHCLYETMSKWVRKKWK